jgi:hypothetical protein
MLIKKGDNMRKYRNDPDYGDYKMEEKRDRREFKSVATEGSMPKPSVMKAFKVEMEANIKTIKGGK